MSDNDTSQNPDLRPLLPWLAALGAVGIVALGVYDLFGSPSNTELLDTLARVEIIVGLIVLAAIATIARRNQALIDLPAALQKVQDRYTDLEAVRREHYKMRSSLDSQLKQVESACQQLVDYQSELQKLVRFVAELQERQKQFDDANIELRQSVGELQRREHQWVERSTELLDYFERTVHHAGLDDAAKNELAKGLAEFERCMLPLGYSVVRPERGTAFDASVMRVVGEQPDSGVDIGAVVACESWGIVFAGNPVRKAEVQLAKNSDDNIENGRSTRSAQPTSDLNAPDSANTHTAEAEPRDLRGSAESADIVNDHEVDGDRS